MILGGCILLYLLVVGFVLPSGSKYHGDERFYTDAALRMCDTGDYWTPYFASGKIRLLKPIAAYWGVAGSFKAFGVSLFTSRVPSVIAGAFSILATFYLGRAVFRSDRIGALAALALASNIEFLTLSARATPDAQVTLWTVVSLLGFARIWFQERTHWSSAFLAWGGIGLAIQTKGLLGLCPLGAILLFMIIARPENWRTAVRTALDWRAILLGCALALFWYLWMVKVHGIGALRDFFDDQVGAKVSLSPGFILHNFFTYAMAGIRHFLPWTLVLGVGLILARRDLSSFWRAHRPACIFLLVLFPMLVCAFSFGNMRTSRYVMISYPALAVLLAALLNAWWKDERGFLSRAIPALGGFLTVLSSGFIAASFWLGWRLAFAGALLVALGGTGFFMARCRESLLRWCWIAGLMVVLYGVFDGAIRPTSTPTPFLPMARALFAEGAAGQAVYTWQVEETAASQLRLAGHNKFQVRQLTRANFHEQPRLLLTTARGTEKLSPEAYAFRKVELEDRALQVRDLLRPFRRTDRGRNTAGRNTEYWIATRRAATEASHE